MDIALLKDGKLVRMSKSVIDAANAVMKGEADSLHNVKSLEELNTLLQGNGQAPAGEDGPEVDLEKLLELMEGGVARVLERGKTLGNQAQVRLAGVSRNVRDRSRTFLEELRKAVHEATKPRDGEPAASKERRAEPSDGQDTRSP
jgi:hypothetical protein